MTRDIRYGLTHGLAFRGKADGVPLLVEMATRDPITLIRQQARYALTDIQDACRLAGRPVPEIRLPDEQPLEALYTPKSLTWPEPRPADVARTCEAPPADAVGLAKYVEQCLA